MMGAGLLVLALHLFGGYKSSEFGVVLSIFCAKLSYYLQRIQCFGRCTFWRHQNLWVWECIFEILYKNVVFRIDFLGFAYLRIQVLCGWSHQKCCVGDKVACGSYENVMFLCGFPRFGLGRFVVNFSRFSPKMSRLGTELLVLAEFECWCWLEVPKVVLGRKETVGKVLLQSHGRWTV